MKNPSDPAEHRAAELRLIDHVQKLLDDPRLRIDTVSGTRPVAGLKRGVARADSGADLKRTMAGLDLPDRDLHARMPQGEVMEVLFRRTRWLLLNSIAARLRVICTSPVTALLKGEAARPMTVGEVNRLLAQYDPHEGKPADAGAGVPTTVILLSTSGFAHDTHDLAGRVASRTLVLVEPNRAGGYTVWGPNELKSLTDLVNPETEAEKRQRVRDAVKTREADLVTGGLAADRVADQTLLPLPLVEDELKSVAKQAAGLLAKRLDGRIVLYREGTTPAGSAGGAGMPLIERIKSIFSGRTSNEKKIAFLSERRAALSQQRDALADELALLEKRDAYLRQQFRQGESEPARRRVAAQMVQLHKELDRRTQMLTVLNQQVNVIASHLHTLDLLQQGRQGKLPESDVLAADAARAEEMLAKLQAESEVADAVSPAIGGGAMGVDEQAMFDELSRESAAAAEAGGSGDAAAGQAALKQAGGPAKAPDGGAARRAEPEAG